MDLRLTQNCSTFPLSCLVVFRQKTTVFKGSENGAAYKPTWDWHGHLAEIFLAGGIPTAAARSPGKRPARPVLAAFGGRCLLGDGGSSDQEDEGTPCWEAVFNKAPRGLCVMETSIPSPDSCALGSAGFNWVLLGPFELFSKEAIQGAPVEALSRALICLDAWANMGSIIDPPAGLFARQQSDKLDSRWVGFDGMSWLVTMA